MSAPVASLHERSPSGSPLTRPHATSAVVVVLGVLSPAFAFFVTATILPSVIRDIGGLGLYAWASTAYAVASILGSASNSVIVRKTGMRGSLLLASAVFAVGCVICALAPTMPVLIAGRACQGLGGGMMIAGIHAVVRELFPQGLWSMMLATISAAWGIAAMSGPAVGGLFAGSGLWRGAFWAMLPPSIVAAAMMSRVLPRAEPGRTEARAPLGRLALICTSVLCVGTIANVAWPVVRVALVLAALATIAIALRLDRTATHRLFPERMLSLAGPMGNGFWMILFLSMCTTPGSVYTALLLQILQDLPPGKAGYFYAAQSLAWTTASLVTARWAGRKIRVALTIGPLMIAAGFVGLATTIASGPVLGTAASIVLVGSGIGLCWSHVCAILLAAGRHDEGAITASTIPTTQTFAIGLGAAISGIIANTAGLSRSASKEVAAVAAVWLFGSFVVVPLIALCFGARVRITPSGRPSSPSP